MYISTFEKENIINSEDLVIKSLILVAFISQNSSTASKIKIHKYKKDLEVINNHPIVDRYCFLSIINPIGNNLISKNIIEPQDRKGIYEAFKVINSDILYYYFQTVDVLSSIISLN